MADLNVCARDASTLKSQFDAGDITATAITQAALDAIAATEPQLNAYITTMNEQALVQAADIDKRKAAGEKLGSLAGTTIAVKDNMATNGVRTTCASQILDNWIPVYDATIVEKLKAADAIITIAMLTAPAMARAIRTSRLENRTSLRRSLLSRDGARFWVSPEWM